MIHTPLTVDQCIARGEDYSFITKEEMEEWQPICSLGVFQLHKMKKKLEANNLLRNALWKYSRTMNYNSWERGGFYEFYINSLNFEAESLRKIIDGYDQDGNIKDV